MGADGRARTGSRNASAWRRRSLTSAWATVPGLLLAAVSPASAQDPDRGRTVYERWCAECHGLEGRGDGPAASYMLPRPRDFRQARYQIRTTANGELPTDDDLRGVLENGMPGTAMPGWANLTAAQREDVIAYIKTFSPYFEDAPPAAMEFGSEPRGGEEALTAGREAYRKLECWKCHGDAGRGDGQSAPTLEDWRDLPIRAADLTEPWLFNGGQGVDAVHARLLTGLDGTPMPAYSDALESGVVTADELWQVARYVHSLGPGRRPEVRELIAARRAESELPRDADDPAWDRVTPSYVPLVGQVVRRPRQFAPTVDGIWVRALHDGEDLAVLVTWSDPSRSPDPAWAEWQAKIAPILYADEAAVRADSSMADGLAIEFPVSLPDGMERPYFLMGDEADPVYLWYWDSEAGIAEAHARGLGALEAVDAGGLSGTADWADGQWRLLLRRSLTSEDESVLTFAEGIAIPVGFFAWDGSSAEAVQRGSISSWYFIYLEEPSSAAVYTIPLLAAVLTGVLGYLAILQARRRRDGFTATVGQPA